MPREKRKSRCDVHQRKELALADHAITETRELDVIDFPRERVFESETLLSAKVSGLELDEFVRGPVTSQHAFEERSDFVGLHARAETECLFAARSGAASGMDR